MSRQKITTPLSRLERDEAPDKVEAEMDDLLEGDAPFVLESKKGVKTAG